MLKRNFFVKGLFGVAVLAAFATFAVAQAPEAAKPEVPLTLGECLRMALENNLDLVIARKDPEISRQGILFQESAFDSAVDANGRYSSQSTNTEFTDVTGTQKTDSSVDAWGGGVGWGQKVTFGADYRIGVETSETNPSPTVRVDQNLGLTSVSDNLFKNTNLTFQYNMPLLRGFGRELNTSDIVLARGGLTISESQLRAQAENTLKQVEDAYWDLLAAHKAVEVANESLKLAGDLLNLNKKKVEVGTLAPIEIVQAEAGVASREEGVILAEQQVGDAEDNLRRLLAIPENDPRWGMAFVPTDKPTFEERQVDLEGSMAKALASRPELESAKRQVEDSRLSERVAEQGIKHRLDLAVAASTPKDDQEIRTTIISGGAVNPTRVDQTDNSFDWSVALVYGYPIGNRAAKANYAIATLNREKTETGLANEEQSIRVDVRAAVRAVQAGVKRVQAAQANTVLQRKTLDAEQRKFENGMSTSFEILRIQTDLSNAQLSQIRAVLDYNKALADLERAQGTLLEARGLRLDMPTGGPSR